ncbi:MAG: hypothetical protein JRM99_06455 [Nitrososphaerota archaeon]|nr:hypothetical protein [Nitrososphaerota archaeon]
MDDLARTLEGTYGPVKVFGVEGNPRAVIVKTDVHNSTLMRERGDAFGVGGKKLSPVLTSGAVGNLKRRAREGDSNGTLHER